MSNQKKLEQLNSAKQSLLESFQEECTFSQKKLEQLQRNASDSHNKTESFFCEGSRVMASLLQDRINTGYTYVDHQASALQLQNGNISLQLVKPEDIISSEIAELKLKVKEDYLAELELSKARLIKHIANLNIQIKALENTVKIEAKVESDLAKEIAKVEKELLSDASSEGAITNV